MLHSLSSKTPTLQVAPSFLGVRTSRWILITIVILLVSLVWMLMSPSRHPTTRTITAQDYDVRSNGFSYFLDEGYQLSAMYNSKYDLSNHTRTLCSPFLFPRPTNDIYITGWPNHGAGLGHQFGEWLYAPYIAIKYNITFVHTGFLLNGARWTEWLGFGACEDVEDDILNSDSIVHIEQWSEDDQFAKDSILLESWLRNRIIIHSLKNSKSIPKLSAPTSNTHRDI